jgi:hypothetical protein
MKTKIRCIRFTHQPKSLYLIAAAALALNSALPAIAEEVVQIDVKSILNTRSVSTYTDGKTLNNL